MGRAHTPAVVTALSIALIASACVSSKRAAKGRKGFEQAGLASWYGPGFHGRTTANGETYDMEAMTAAHKHLPFGSIVEVINRDNGRRTRVRINDRGPFVRGRIIDLSKAAARDIGMLGPGTAKVRIRVVGKSQRPARVSASRDGPGAAKTVFTVQAGAFRDRPRAEARLAAVRVHYSDARLVSSGDIHRVVIRDLSERSAREAREKLARLGIESLVVR